MISPNQGETEQFRTFIARRLGLQFDDSKLDFLAEVLKRRLASSNFSHNEYLAWAASDSSKKETGALAQELTIPETYFFRNIDQFHAVREIVLPERLHARAAQKTLRILSAGCASGEEAYSLAMLVQDAPIDPTWQVSIRAIDINPAIIKKATQARFSSWALRETPLEFQQRWFRPDGRDMVLDKIIRNAVTFEERNLIDEDYDLWQANSYDIVFCRNALMYLLPEHMQAVVARIARSLAPGGYLFLGHAETLRNVSEAFHLQHTHGTFYYQRRIGKESSLSPVQPRNALPVVSGAASVVVSAVASENNGDWADAIGKASARIGKLAGNHPAPQIAPAGPSPSKQETQAVFDLLLQERFEDALNLVRSFPPTSAKDPKTLLLRAMLLTHKGEFADAEEACWQLLKIDEMNAGAHYVLALCRESTGDRDGAADHDRVSVYLDPSFSMPRLHLGLLARRTGDRDSARRELAQASMLLKHEDASRLLLFGGGFTRQALTALCESALRDCEGAS